MTIKTMKHTNLEILQIGFKEGFLLSQNIVSISDFFINVKIADEYSAITILCELDQNEKGQCVKMQELYGIELAKQLRLKDINLPIIFSSFLSRKQVYKRHPQSEILKFVGHSFVQLPAKPQDFIDAAKKLKTLSPLELKDVQLFACNPDGIVNAKIHQIPYLSEKLKTEGSAYVKKELENYIKEMHLAFHQNYESYLAEFEKGFSIINETSIERAIDAVAEKAKSLIMDYKRKIGKRVTNDDKKPWKLLLLDDELNKESKIVKALEANGVNVIYKSAADEAMSVLEKDDALRGKISVILTDYRLYEQAQDGMQVQQQKQGYAFLQDVGEKYYSKVMSAIVYSGMPRQFLLDNLNTFKIRTEKYSKADFKPGDTGAINYLVSRIIEVGDKNYEALLALPLGNAGWRNHLHKYYLVYRNLPDYEIKEREICDYCTKWIDQFRNNQNPATPMIKGDAFEAKLKESEADTISRFIAYYKTRRLAQYLYLYFENRRKEKIRNEIADILMHPEKSRKNQKTIDGFFSQVLGVSLTEFPLGAAMEELNWFEYDLDIKVLNSYNRHRERFNEYENLIGDFISGDKALMQLLKENNYCIKDEKGNEITFSTEKYNPYLFDKMDLGFCLEWLEKQIKEMNKYAIEECIQLIQQLKQAWN